MYKKFRTCQGYLRNNQRICRIVPDTLLIHAVRRIKIVPGSLLRQIKGYNEAHKHDPTRTAQLETPPPALSYNVADNDVLPD